MTAQLSRERIEYYAKQTPDMEKRSFVYEEIRVMASMLLAGMDSKAGRNPVLAYADSYRDMAKLGVESVPIWSVITDIERNIAPLFTAPPAPVPVAVPDNLLHMAADAIEDLLGNTDRSSSAAAWYDLPGKLRAAIQAEPGTLINEGTKPVSQRYTLPPHIYRELVNQLRDTAVKYQGCQQLREQLSETLSTVITPAVNSSIPEISGSYTLPDGWKLVPVEPTPEMLSTITEAIKVMRGSAATYSRVLAAAPAAPEQGGVICTINII